MFKDSSGSTAPDGRLGLRLRSLRICRILAVSLVLGHASLDLDETPNETRRKSKRSRDRLSSWLVRSRGLGPQTVFFLLFSLGCELGKQSQIMRHLKGGERNDFIQGLPTIH